MPKRRPPEATGYTIDALAKAAGVTVRTARFYFAEDVVQRPTPRGPATRYTDDQLLRVRAARKLRFDGLRLPEVRQRLRTMSSEEVRAYVDPPTRAPEAAPPAVDASMERWERATLLPGLELLVRADADPLVQRMAREIVAAYRAR